MKLKIILPVLLVLAQAGCREEFTPPVERQMSAIVVEGLLTNLKESYKVRISMATPYDSSTNNTSVTGASVSIIDDLGNSYLMHEQQYQKYYYSDTSEFITVPGRSYKVHIEIPGGDIYESSVQKLAQPASVDSIYGYVAGREFWYKDQLGEIATKTVFGAETFIDLTYSSDSIVQFRFDNTLMKCYSYLFKYTPEMKAAGIPFPPPEDCPGAVCPYKIYCWEKFDLETGTDLSQTTRNLISERMEDCTVCFLPFDTSFYQVSYVNDSCAFDMKGNLVCAEIRQRAGSEGMILETRLYALNQTSADYYKEINDQLSYEGRLFDPVAVQLKGNIKCISDPHKPALGLFEVSSCTPGSYWLWYFDGFVKYQPIEDTSGLPGSGSGREIPEFWQLFFDNDSL